MRTTQEQWKTIPSFQNYEASSWGNIRRNGKLRKVEKHIRTGRNIIYLIDNNGRRCRKNVSHLVCEAFHGVAPKGKPYACHTDGDHTNDIPSNLRWDSPRNNSLDMFKHNTALIGFKHPRAKATDIYDYKTNKLVASQVCLSQWAKANSVSRPGLQNTLTGKQSNAGGYYALR